jgi:hypothetical protein
MKIDFDIWTLDNEYRNYPNMIAVIYADALSKIQSASVEFPRSLCFKTPDIWYLGKLIGHLVNDVTMKESEMWSITNVQIMSDRQYTDLESENVNYDNYDYYIVKFVCPIQE